MTAHQANFNKFLEWRGGQGMSNTFHLSGDNWELSGCSLSSLQLIVIAEVTAPTLAPAKAGDRGKRTRRDALNLVRSHRSGDLAAVWIPGPRSEAFRDLGGRGRRAGSTACAASAEQISAARRKWSRTHRHCAISRRFWR